MTRYFALFLLLLSVSAAAQNQAPAQLHEAAHCLVTDLHNWLDPQTLKATELNLGIRYDAKTVLGEKYLYVVVYTEPHRHTGRIFDIRYKQRDHHHVYIIENSAAFIITPKGVEFADPPVGGQWAQNQITPAIEKIEHHKWYTAEMKYLRKPNNHVVCETTLETAKPAAE